MAEREYAVTYMTKDGQQRSEVLVGKNHTHVERKIAALGGTVLNIERNEDSYPRKARSRRRTIGCFVIVVLASVLMVALYWFRFYGHR